MDPNKLAEQVLRDCGRECPSVTEENIRRSNALAALTAKDLQLVGCLASMAQLVLLAMVREEEGNHGAAQALREHYRMAAMAASERIIEIRDSMTRTA